jgi:hypothetical protein
MGGLLMSFNRGRSAALVAAIGAALSAAAMPTASADPVWPVAGAEPADATLRDLAAQGYDVQINWVGGYSNVSLSECKVTAIHNPDGAPTSHNPLATVYVDISCPSNNFD